MADCKRKTANLFDKSSDVVGYYIYSGSGAWIQTGSTSRSILIKCEPNTTYTIFVPTNKTLRAEYFNNYPSAGDTGYGYTNRTTEDYVNKTLTITTSSSAQYLAFFCYNSAQEATMYDEAEYFSQIMLNTGSTALPYEPYGWLHSLRKLTTATDTITTLPADLYSDGTAITAYTIKGNTTQSGTPSPSNPVEVNGVGERTENLWNEAYTGISSSSVTYFPIYVGSGDFTLSTTARKTEFPNPSQNGNANIFFLTGNVSSGASTSGNGVWNGQNRTVTATDGYVTIAYRYLVDDSGSDPRDNDTMLNSGSTAKPYEPYGYKIPILNGQTTTPIYLGSTSSTRQIKKLVLDGTETWYINNQGTVNAFFSMVLANPLNVNLGISTHFIFKGIYTSNDDVGFYVTTTGELRIRPDNVSSMTKSDFTTWLSQQYANGTPVTVWYVLATETTGIVNEPLRKIGDYADTVSGITIPTIAGANTISVGTTVQPSEFTATWTGWHDAEVKEKSENLFDYETMKGGKTGYYLDKNGNEVVNAGFWSITKYIPVDGTTFTLTRTFGGNAPAICLYDSNKNFITGVSYQGEQVVTISSNTNAAYIRFSYFIGEPLEDVAHDMLNEGSTALPYEPYWK